MVRARTVTYECRECGSEIVVTASGESQLSPIYCCDIEVIETTSIEKKQTKPKKKTAKKIAKKIAKKKSQKQKLLPCQDLHDEVDALRETRFLYVENVEKRRLVQKHTQTQIMATVKTG